MITAEAARLETDTIEWPVWSTTARVVVTDPAALEQAYAQVSELVAAVDAVASRFRTDSEINRAHAATGRPVLVSPLLEALLTCALDAARRTGGDVDPTVGAALVDLGYDRDLNQLDRTVDGPLGRVERAAPELPPTGGLSRITVVTAPSWRQVQLADGVLTLPPGVVIDLGATAKAWTADRAATKVAELLGTGVLVSLGGDIATAGPAPEGGWQIRVQDDEGEPASDVALPAGASIATSSTIRRQWRHGERALHHILDPRTLSPADPVWRTVTVAASTCVDANTLTTAAVVRGEAAWSWLSSLGLPARLVHRDGSVRTTATWPQAGWSASSRAGSRTG